MTSKKGYTAPHKPTNVGVKKASVKPLTEEALSQLEGLLDQLADMVEADDVDVRYPMSLDMVDGFFAALALSPSNTAIGEWMPLVFGDARFEDKTLTQGLRNLLIQHQSAVAHLLRKTNMDDYFPCVSWLDNAEGQEVADVRMWCAGFVIGYERQAEKWQSLMDEPALAELNAIMALKDSADEDDGCMSEAEVAYHHHQQALVSLMRSELSDMLQEPADDVALIMFALTGLQSVMLAPSKPSRATQRR